MHSATTPLDHAVSVDVACDFDPLSDLFVAQSTRPAHVQDVNLRALTPFQRALLVIDGTVTKFIEAYTMEPVEIVHLGQEIRRLDEDHAWLDVAKRTRVVARQVLLRGTYSRSLHAYATSLIVPERLDERVKGDLEPDGDGIGRILLQYRAETRREVLWYGREDGTYVPTHVRQLTNGEYISRTYRIIAGEQPIMLINEKFPYDADRLPSQY